MAKWEMRSILALLAAIFMAVVIYWVTDSLQNGGGTVGRQYFVQTPVERGLL